MRSKSGVLEIVLRVRQNLTGISASQLEQPPQHCRLAHTRLQQNIASNRRLDEGIEDVPPPALCVADQWSDLKRA
jgi:hypothetical protein